MASDQGSRSRAGKGEDTAGEAARPNAELHRNDAADDLEEDEESGWPEGLVAGGGRLDGGTVTGAYRAGIFPWSPGPEIAWWSPDPRAIFDLPTFHVPRTVKKSIRRGGWTFAIDRDFE